MFNKLLELEPELNPSSIMIDFEKAAMNSLEKKFIACVSGCFFHLSQSIYRKIQANGLTTDYQQDRDFALKLKMLPCLAFVPEIDAIDSFNILMQEYPHLALSVAKYFEDTYIGKDYQIIADEYLLFLLECGIYTQGSLTEWLVQTIQ